MDRWGWMAVKAYVPTGLMLVGSLILLLVVAKLGESRYFAAMMNIAQWVPIAAFIAAAGVGLWTTLRLWKWERGEALTCDCGGLLGRERLGIRDRGDYRRCIACGRNVNSRHYN